MRNYDLTNPNHMIRCVGRERYTWPGGYELCVITYGGLLCSGCVREEYYNILHSTKHDINDGWKCVGIVNESELEDGFCAHCNKELGY